MPYFFPYEDLFVYTIVVIIVGLLFMRVRLTWKRRKDVMTQTHKTHD